MWRRTLRYVILDANDHKPLNRRGDEVKILSTNLSVSHDDAQGGPTAALYVNVWHGPALRLTPHQEYE